MGAGALNPQRLPGVPTRMRPQPKPKIFVLFTPNQTIPLLSQDNAPNPDYPPKPVTLGSWSRGDEISLCFKSPELDFPKDLATEGYFAPPSVAFGFASGQRVSTRSRSWKIKAPPPSSLEKRHYPVIAYDFGGYSPQTPQDDSAYSHPKQGRI